MRLMRSWVFAPRSCTVLPGAPVRYPPLALGTHGAATDHALRVWVWAAEL